MERLAGVKAARIAALADPSEENLALFVDRHQQVAKAPRFGNYEEMLEEVELDGVIIASPHTLHAEQIRASLRRGLHVLTEKPMACTVKEAQSVIRAAKRHDRIVMIGYQRHFSPAFRRAREIIASGDIGEVTFAAALQAQNWLAGTRGTWRQDPSLSGGGQLNDSGSHLVDIVLWVTGLQPEVVCALVDNRGSKVDILSSLTVRFRGGAIGNLAVIGDAPQWWEDISWYCEGGALYVRDGRLLLQRGSKTEEIKGRSKSASDPDRNFVDSILGKDEPQTPAIGGLRVAELTEAAWESARSGRPAKVTRARS
jgi:predicted dehydrogenase